MIEKKGDTMHIPDGALPISHCVIYWALILPFLALYIREVRGVPEEEGGRKLVHTAIIATFVFAVTLFEIPTPVGIPFHLLMIPFAAIALGREAGVMISFLVLLLQFILVGEGGFTTLGANTLVMGVCCSYVSAGFYNLIKDVNEKIGILSGVFGGIITAAALNALILAYAGVLPLKFILIFNITAYTPAGIGEGVITMILIEFLRKIGYGGVMV
ncbi:MAG: hypothetical protein CW694_00080 [Candidatus Syntrophoarchaeum sp. WYZ-LMO15]|nr:MAG: hypothetical protein CW694_00080 [Candidatus Syntrophoarchaeum sp. WYZ-LMO15]